MNNEVGQNYKTISNTLNLCRPLNKLVETPNLNQPKFYILNQNNAGFQTKDKLSYHPSQVSLLNKQFLEIFQKNNKPCSESSQLDSKLNKNGSSTVAHSTGSKFIILKTNLPKNIPTSSILQNLKVLPSCNEKPSINFIPLIKQGGNNNGCPVYLTYIPPNNNRNTNVVVPNQKCISSTDHQFKIKKRTTKQRSNKPKFKINNLIKNEIPDLTLPPLFQTSFYPQKPHPLISSFLENCKKEQISSNHVLALELCATYRQKKLLSNQKPSKHKGQHQDLFVEDIKYEFNKYGIEKEPKPCIFQLNTYLDPSYIYNSSLLSSYCLKPSLPNTLFCKKHIMESIPCQQLFARCSAKFPNYIQCSTPTFDLLNDVPLCWQHARKKAYHDFSIYHTKGKRTNKQPPQQHTPNLLPYMTPYLSFSKKNNCSLTFLPNNGLGNHYLQVEQAYNATLNNKDKSVKRNKRKLQQPQQFIKQPQCQLGSGRKSLKTLNQSSILSNNCSSKMNEDLNSTILSACESINQHLNNLNKLNSLNSTYNATPVGIEINNNPYTIQNDGQTLLFDNFNHQGAVISGYDPFLGTCRPDKDVMNNSIFKNQNTQRPYHGNCYNSFSSTSTNVIYTSIPSQTTLKANYSMAPELPLLNTNLFYNVDTMMNSIPSTQSSSNIVTNNENNKGITGLPLQLSMMPLTNQSSFINSTLPFNDELISSSPGCHNNYMNIQTEYYINSSNSNNGYSFDLSDTANLLQTYSSAITSTFGANSTQAAAPFYNTSNDFNNLLISPNGHRGGSYPFNNFPASINAATTNKTIQLLSPTMIPHLAANLDFLVEQSSPLLEENSLLNNFGSIFPNMIPPPASNNFNNFNNIFTNNMSFNNFNNMINFSPISSYSCASNGFNPLPYYSPQMGSQNQSDDINQQIESLLDPFYISSTSPTSSLKMIYNNSYPPNSQLNTNNNQNHFNHHVNGKVSDVLTDDNILMDEALADITRDLSVLIPDANDSEIIKQIQDNMF